MKRIFALVILLGMCIVTSAAEEVVRVRAQGIGTTFEEAIRNACRTAVGHVTGTICKERTEINAVYDGGESPLFQRQENC